MRLIKMLKENGEWANGLVNISQITSICNCEEGTLVWTSGGEKFISFESQREFLHRLDKTKNRVIKDYNVLI